MNTAAQSSLDRMVAATPAQRDRYVDFLRALSIFVVVFGHWLMAIIVWRDGSFSGASALDEINGIWILTWILQVMPLFFFVGGFSNSTSWNSIERRGGGYGDFLRSRMNRLLRPTSIFVATWLAAAFAIVLFGGSLGDDILQASGLIAKPLWFLAVYVLAVAVAPFMLRIHRRFGVRAAVGLGIAAAVVDVARVGFGLEAIGYLNFAFVWLLVHQLGFFYADGSLVRAGARVHRAMAALGIGLVAVLTTLGPYANSMVGTASDEASNNSPPSVCLIALTFWLVGAAMLLRPRVATWLQKQSAWKAVIAANSMIMTAFLWHLTALLVVAAVVYPLGWPQPAAGSLGWWLMRPLWIALLLVALAPFVVLFGRFEKTSGRARRENARSEDPASPATARYALAIGLLTLALSGFAAAGFNGVLDVPAADLGALHTHPLVNGLWLLGGRFLLRRSPLWTSEPPTAE